MAALTFNSATLAGKTVYVAEIENVKGTINVDLEREAKGMVTVYHRAHGTTNYKGGVAVAGSQWEEDINFNIISEAPNAEMDYKIVSDTNATGIYA
jgi:hypothetical protein